MENLVQHPLYSDYFCDLSSGEVYSTKKSNYNKEGEFKKLKPSINGRGYLQFSMSYEGKQINKLIHSFVFECGTNKTYEYSNKSPEGLTINHKDGNKLNNKFSNLELINMRTNSQLSNNLTKENKKSKLPRFVTPSGKKFMIKIHIKGKQTYFGTYPTIEEAEQVARLKFEELYPTESY